MADEDDKSEEEELEFPEEKTPERPLECSECKKPIAVKYTEIVGHSIIHTCMCADCPELERRLHGIPHREGGGEESKAQRVWPVATAEQHLSHCAMAIPLDVAYAMMSSATSW